MRRHNEIHHILITNHAGRQEQLIGPESRARALDELRNGLVGLEFHADRKETGRFGVAAEFLLHGLQQTVTILIGVDAVDVFEVFGWGGAQYFENAAFFCAPLALDDEERNKWLGVVFQS